MYRILMGNVKYSHLEGPKRRCEMDGTGAESYPVAVFGISCAEPSGSVTSYFICSILHWPVDLL
jgi:hypothetical protein